MPYIKPKYVIVSLFTSISSPCVDPIPKFNDCFFYAPLPAWPIEPWVAGAFVFLYKHRSASIQRLRVKHPQTRPSHLTIAKEWKKKWFGNISLFFVSTERCLWSTALCLPTRSSSSPSPRRPRRERARAGEDLEIKGEFIVSRIYRMPIYRTFLYIEEYIVSNLPYRVSR